MNLSDFNPITAVLGKVADVAQKYFPSEQERAKFLADVAHVAAEDQAKLEQIAADDRKSARERQSALGDWTPQILAYTYTAGFFILLGVQLYFVFAGIEINSDAQRTLDITTGVLFAFVLASKDYFLGSSASVKSKDALTRHMWDTSP